MIIKYYERQPGGGYRLVEDGQFVEVYADHTYIWGRNALMVEYNLPETIICRIIDLKCIEEVGYEAPESH